MKKKIRKPKKTIKKKTIVSLPKPIKLPSNLKPLRELALHSPYTMGYLSLMARRKQLKVKKIGRIWYSSMANIKEFEEKMAKQKEENEKLRKSYIDKAEKVKISVMDDRKADIILSEVQKDTLDNAPVHVQRLKPTSNDTIFDEVQGELEDILLEIRAKEKKLRHDYMVYRGKSAEGVISKIPAANEIQQEKNKTEKMSEDLIENMGKLLRTANEIHNVNARSVQQAMHSGTFSFGASHVAHDDFYQKLNENNDHLLGNYHRDNFLSVPYSYFPFEHNSKPEISSKKISSSNKLLLFVSGIMVFVAAMLLVLVLFS